MAFSEAVTGTSQKSETTWFQLLSGRNQCARFYRPHIASPEKVNYLAIQRVQCYWPVYRRTIFAALSQELNSSIPELHMTRHFRLFVLWVVFSLVWAAFYAMRSDCLCSLGSYSAPWCSVRIPHFSARMYLLIASNMLGPPLVAIAVGAAALWTMQRGRSRQISRDHHHLGSDAHSERGDRTPWSNS
jgi:hypothetical protein